jgi:peptidoglycan/xylan/chitin deacetylase (PgdA/CDA1 family)
VAYFQLTPEGALLWARLRTSIWTPELPRLTDDDAAWISEHAPSYKDAVALLVWHGIGSESDGDGGFSVSPERFGEQLAALRSAGMNSVTAREVALSFAGMRRLPRNAVMISFDDGRTDAMLYADPLLEQADMRATMFVITEAASSSAIYYVKWDELREYASSGRWDIQSHSAESHYEQEVPDGRSLPALTSLAQGESLGEYEQRISRDLSKAAYSIENQIGIPPVAFAYPFGAYGSQYDSDRTNHEDIESILRDEVEDNYEIAVEQDDQHTWELATCADDPVRLRRLEIGNWSARTLIARISRAASALPAEIECASP